ncbi:hypothetical protein [Kitasatospora kifunensis]|uniref:Uncharacterized protein n=1 Tax=Kitasatospora kifunensis TaxID=58351 RepID=A0A7W7VU16_KITKI|nr:hypothetical protein [Kitasatospora kifunensis]MBB4921990.1 hypothetical protein [Kitasatospora kifunensis]
MDPELETLAASAATTLISLMISDSWTQAKEKVRRFFAPDSRSGSAPSDLDASRAELVAAREAGHDLLVADIEAEWRVRLRRLLSADRTTGEELRDLIDSLARISEATLMGSVHNVVSGGVQHGPIIQSGRISGLTFTTQLPESSEEGTEVRLRDHR